MNIEHIAAGTTLTTISGMPAMSSQEIAEITGRQHKNVLRDIRKMLGQLAEAERHPGSDLSWDPKWVETHMPDAQGQLRPVLLLDKELTFTLLAGYSYALSNLIVKRWLELEGNGFRRVSVAEAVAHLVEREKDIRRMALRELRRLR
ncbi:Rha family transcriptional regulator [Pseudomonas sp. DTU_2021_1001937_2_SI_NGA_ILE_001]|uniref:Rha family transcriptional regulator n=1 Tax=Pseudomonas sp. DTU_2021_1001937_2_SI_NGA_ILE_001 TaxID=3077589 RepID=UPI0028FC12F4|nr:Rha family transcriptional regulator [Pseudomonas sp. DTU_2021_1001937_2_SI_NGA_ILE_001]WNW12409.1 Rha family transcriptional regulator [Pseudomonas sp. DTU_2021_1001937_2_SI_NGA_ILE_001]